MNKIALYLLMLFLAVPLYAAPLRETSIPNGFGVNVHFLGKAEDHIKLLKEAGFGWVRKDFDWASIEKERGEYNFEKYDTFVNAMNDAGIKVLLILNYRNPLYDSNLSPYTNIGRRAFAGFAEAAAKHYANNDVAWEIYNEPNWGFWKPTPKVEDYIELARVVTRALKRAAPHQPILAPALAGPTSDQSKKEASYTYLNAVLNDPIARQWDAISIHPYCTPKKPECIFNETSRLNALLTKHGIRAPYIFSEWGYHTADTKGVSEDMQAAYAARAFLITSSMRMPFSIWYDWQDTSDDTSDGEHNYGLLHYNMLDSDSDETRKPAFHAIRELGQALNGYRFDKIISHTNGIYGLRFKKGRNLAYALWTSEIETQPYQLALPAGRWQVATLLSNSVVIDVKDKQPLALQLQAMPLIVSRVIK
ncbi:MAG: cellulase family glycosylhydrolase [Alphaproteobacteria bacterium]|nr:cellulase family glycosylhydrolase [Alphaproteobacteria bacterium]